MVVHTDESIVTKTNASSVSSATAHVNGEPATGRWGEHTEAESVNIDGAYQEFEE